MYRQGPESDIYVLKPAEFHASNSELIRILQAGHHGVEVPEEDMRTLYAWIDLNAPYYGAFTQIDLKPQSPKGQVERRMELAEKYSGVRVDWQKEIADYADWLKENKKADGITGATTGETVEIKKPTKPVRPVKVKGSRSTHRQRLPGKLPKTKRPAASPSLRMCISTWYGFPPAAL